MKYLKLFDLDADYQSFIGGGGFITPNVSYTLDTKISYFNPKVDYSKEYLTFTALENDMTVSFNKKASAGTLNYSLDEGNTWTELTDTTPYINSGEKIIFKGNMTPVSYSGIGIYSTTKNFNVSGNIMSLLYGDDFVGQIDLTGRDFAFRYLFSGCTVVNAKDLILPATTLANNCYERMFQDCKSLTSAPVLPATTLAEDCYSCMFYNCKSLTSAPELPATTLADWCYSYMFQGCSSLNYIKMLATDISANKCLNDWVSNVSPTGTFVKNKNATWNITGTSGIPSGWTVVEE